MNFAVFENYLRKNLNSKSTKLPGESQIVDYERMFSTLFSISKMSSNLFIIKHQKASYKIINFKNFLANFDLSKKTRVWYS